MSALLAVPPVSKSFGGFRAVGSVDLTIDADERRVVIGPNGAGRTTLLQLGDRSDAPEGLERSADPRRDERLAAHRIATTGISPAVQITEIFGRLTVRQNVQIALVAASSTAYRPWGNASAEEVDEADAILSQWVF